VRRSVQGALIRMLGPSVTSVRAKATAAIVGSVPSGCIYTLDPNSAGAFNASNGAIVTMNCSIEVKSSNANGGTVTGAAEVTATAIDGNFKISGGGSATPAPSGQASTVAD